MHSLPAAALRLEPTTKTFGESVSSTAKMIGHKAKDLAGMGSASSEKLQDLSQAELVALARERGLKLPEGTTRSALLKALKTLD